MLWDYNDNLVSRVSKPDDCFRLTVDHGLDRNYLDAYTVTMEPNGADVSWGPIPWWMDRDDLTCGSMTWEAAEQVDVCGMFEEEVDNLPTPEAIPMTIERHGHHEGCPEQPHGDHAGRIQPALRGCG